MANPKPWPEDDAREALRLHDMGMTWKQVGAVFGKSRSAAEAACRRYREPSSATRDNAAAGPPIGLEMSEIVARNRAKSASASLRRAINALLSRMPERKAEEILGKPAVKIPGTERVYRGQAAERLAA